jgi:hypothetical protein
MPASGNLHNKGSHYSIEPFQLLLGALEVRCAEPFGESFINWNEKIACFSLLMLISPEPGETHGRAELKQVRPLAGEPARAPSNSQFQDHPC